jgi:hypothetical protein
MEYKKSNIVKAGVVHEDNYRVALCYNEIKTHHLFA